MFTVINSKTTQYYQSFFGAQVNPFLSDYLKNKQYQKKWLSYLIILFLISLAVTLIGISKPLFAYNTDSIKIANEPVTINSTVLERPQNNSPNRQIYSQNEFIQNIKKTYPKSDITYVTKGVAHIKKVKYINKKPVKINIVEINQNVNPNLKIKPQIAGAKLNSKSTVRRIAQNNGAIVGINAGFFKPSTGVPLGALMIDRKVLTGPIYNRVGIAFIDDGSYEMDYINFDMSAYSSNGVFKIDNINQPRILSTYTLLYTPDWGKLSPVAPKNCYNMLIVNNNIEKISANPIELGQNSYVIQAPKEIISNIAKNTDKIYIDIKPQKNLINAQHIIAAGPYLVKDNQIFVDYKQEKFNSILGKNPRSAIGYKQDGSLVIVTIDGREEKSVGMTLFELANLMKSIGCINAMNFDGGSSSALYVNGKIANSAHKSTGAPVSNALIVSEVNNNEYQLSKL